MVVCPDVIVVDVLGIAHGVINLGFRYGYKYKCQTRGRRDCPSFSYSVREQRIDVRVPGDLTVVLVVSSLARPCGCKGVIRGKAVPGWIGVRVIGLAEVDGRDTG